MVFAILCRLTMYSHAVTEHSYERAFVKDRIFVDQAQFANSECRTCADNVLIDMIALNRIVDSHMTSMATL